MAGGKRLDVFMDTFSLYSFIALEDLYRSLPNLAANGVHLEIHPFSVGGISQATGNKPPWALKAKADYIPIDCGRACSRVGISGLVFPPDLPARLMTVSSLHALHHIKATFPTATFIASFRALFRSFWLSGNADLEDDDVLRTELLDATFEPEGKGGKIFTEAEVEGIMGGKAAMKGTLTETTDRAVKLGAFGAPWFWATNERGEEEPFFGSDRFNFIYNFLGVPYSDIELKAPGEAKH